MADESPHPYPMRSILGNQFPDEESAEEVNKDQEEGKQSPGPETIGEEVAPEEEEPAEAVVPEAWPADLPEVEAAEEHEVTVEQEMYQFEAPGQPAGLLPTRVVKVIDRDLFGGLLQFPSSVAYDRNMDEIYIIKGGGGHPNSRIVVYGAEDYFPVAAFGRGRQVFSPKALDFDRQGRIFLLQGNSDEKPNRISVFNGAFFLEGEIFLDENMSNLLETYDPRSIAVTEKNIFIVGDPVNGVLVLDNQYKFQGWLTVSKRGNVVTMGGTPNENATVSIVDVVAGEDGRVYLVSLAAGHIYVLDENLELLYVFGTKGGAPGKLSQARSLAVDAKRQVFYVVDYMRHAVNVYNYLDGAFLFEVGGMGTSSGWFQYPNHVEVDRQGNLIVADYFNDRVQVLFVR